MNWIARAGALLRHRRSTSILVVSAISFALALLSVFLTENFVALTSADRFIQDSEVAYLAPVKGIDQTIEVVSINEDTLHQFKYRSPIDRKFLADLIAKIETGHPAAIGVDLLFDQPTEPAKDAALEHVLLTAKTPLAIAYTEGVTNITPAQLAYLRSYVPRKMWAATNLAKDQYGTARWVFPGIKSTDGNYVEGFVRKLAQYVGVSSSDGQTPVIWHRPPPDSKYSFLEVPAQVALIYPSALFNGKIILIGSDLSLTDLHRTPFSTVTDTQMPGVMVHANGLATLLNNDKSPYVRWRTDFFIAFILALIGGGLGVMNIHLMPRIFIMIGLIVAFWIGGFALFLYGNILIDLLSPTVALIASFSALDSLTGLDARQQRHLIQGMFSRYLSPKVVEFLVEHPERASLDAERREMTYLFTDIADFTTFSEKMESRDLAELINEYLEGMTQVVQAHDGMVDKFIGDAVFAIFNVPVYDLPDHAERAVHCALEMDDFAEAFRKRQKKKGRDFGITRIGVLTGPAAVGNFGSKTRLSYTAQGDAVNAASRLEGLNKQFGTHICVSGDTRNRCKNIEFREIASVVLKGKTVPTMVWEPLHADRIPAALLKRYRDAFAKTAEESSEAKSMFASLASDAPYDSLIHWHATRLAEGHFGAEFKMTEK